MATIDAAVKAHLESEVDTFIATRDAGLSPHVGRGWGTRVAESGESFELFVDRPHSLEVLSDLRENGLIAVSWSNVATHKTIQLKGRCIEMGDPAAEDFAWVDKHRLAFAAALQSIGYSAEYTRKVYSNQLVRIRCLIEHAFDQTPGPGAGRPI